MGKCQYTEYLRYPNSPTYPVDCSTTPTYEIDGKKYCYFHYLRLFYADLGWSLDKDMEKKERLKKSYPILFDEDGKFLVTPFIFYEKFYKLISEYEGDALDISGFVFPMEKTQNNDDQIDLTNITPTNRDKITINSQYIDFFNTSDTARYFSSIGDSRSNLNSNGTIIFQNIHCNKYFIFKQKNEDSITLRLVDCNVQELTVLKDSNEEKVGSINLNIEKCKIDTYNHQPIVYSISINKSEINSLPNDIATLYSFNISNSTLSNHLNITASSITIKDIDIGSDNNRIEKVSLTAPLNSITLDNNILQNPLFSYVNHIKIIDTAARDTYNTTTTRFHNVDMRNIIFYDSTYKENKDTNPDNLRKINFINCKYNDGHKLYEKDVSPKRLEYSYLYLRELYDKRGEYIAGNDFHYNYYEIKRKNDKNLSKSDKFFLWLFSKINGHNTKPFYTLLWVIGLFLIFWGLVFLSIHTNINGSITINSLNYNYQTKFMDVIGGSMHAAFSGLSPTSLFNSNITTNNLYVASLLKLESILSTILLLFFGLAIRNRFRRSREIVDIGITGK